MDYSSKDSASWANQAANSFSLSNFAGNGIRTTYVDFSNSIDGNDHWDKDTSTYPPRV